MPTFVYIRFPVKRFVAPWLPSGDATPLTHFLQFSAHGASRNFHRRLFEHTSQLLNTRVFRNLPLPLLLLNDCTSPSFFTEQLIVPCAVLSPMAIIRDNYLADISAQCKPITCPLSNTDVCLVGFIPAWLFTLASSCSKTERNYCYNILIRQICYEETCKNCLHYIYILPGWDKLFGRVARVRLLTLPVTP